MAHAEKETVGLVSRLQVDDFVEVIAVSETDIWYRRDHRRSRRRRVVSQDNTPDRDAPDGRSRRAAVHPAIGTQIGRRRKRPVRQLDGVLLVVVRDDHDIGLGRARPGHHGEVLAEGILVRRIAELEIGGEAVVFLAELHIDNPRDCIRSVDGRSTVFQDFDPLNRCARQRIEVKHGVEAVVARQAIRGHAASIDQHEGVLSAKATQIQGGRAGGKRAGALRVNRAAGVERQIADHIRHRRIAGLVDISAGDIHDRQRSLGIDAFDAGTRDFEGLKLEDFIFLVSRRNGLLGKSGGGREDRQGEREQSRQTPGVGSAVGVHAGLLVYW